MARAGSSAEVFGSFMNRQKFAEKRREMAQKSIEELIETLASEDLQTRFFAEIRLREATSDVTRFQAGEFAAKKRKSHQRMAWTVLRQR